MVINIESTMGYNNQLKQATPGMKLVVNSDINISTKKASLRLMDGGESKINAPNSHPWNPIHKAATAAQETGPKGRHLNVLHSHKARTALQEQKKKGPGQAPTPEPSSHDINKAVIITLAVGIAALLFVFQRRI